MFSDADLIGYVLGALEPHEQERIRETLRTDRELRTRLERIESSLAPLQGSRADIDPPPGLAERTLAAVEAARIRPLDVERTTRDRSWGPRSFGQAGSVRFIDVVLAISACLILITLAVPALLNTRERSRLVSCQWHLKGLGERLTSYAMTRSDRSYPPIYVSDDMAFAGGATVFLRDAGLLEPRSELLLCPGSQLTQDYWLGVPSRLELVEATEDRLEELKRHASGSYALYLGLFDNGRYRPPRHLGRAFFGIASDAPAIESPEQVSFNHGRRGWNVLYDDLHVGFVRLEQVVHSADDPRRNHLGEVAPGIGPNDSVVAPSQVPPRPVAAAFWRPWLPW